MSVDGRPPLRQTPPNQLLTDCCQPSAAIRTNQTSPIDADPQRFHCGLIPRRADGRWERSWCRLLETIFQFAGVIWEDVSHVFGDFFWLFPVLLSVAVGASGARSLGPPAVYFAGSGPAPFHCSEDPTTPCRDPGDSPAQVRRILQHYNQIKSR